MTEALLDMNTGEHSALPATAVHRMTMLHTWPGTCHAAELRIGKIPPEFGRTPPCEENNLERLAELISSRWRAAILAALIDSGPADGDAIASRLQTRKDPLACNLNLLKERGLLITDAGGRHSPLPGLSHHMAELTVYQQHARETGDALRSVVPFLDFATAAWAVIEDRKEHGLPVNARELAAQGTGIIAMGDGNTPRILLAAQRAQAPRSTASYLNALGRAIRGIAGQPGEIQESSGIPTTWRNMDHVR